MLKVLLVDNHPAMRLGLKALLDATPDMRVVGECDDGREALRLAAAAKPGLVVLGLNIVTDMDGIETCRRIKELADAPPILVHTAYNLTEDVSSCLLAGADSYVHKCTGLDDLLCALRRTAAGERVWYVGEGVGEPRSRIHTTPNGERLTVREREVVALVLRDCSNAEMAERLHLSLPTVKTHVRSVLRKLGVKSRREIVRFNP